MMNLFFDFNNASVYNIREVNSSFASGSLKVMYLGENRNGSYFSKDAVEKALPSLKNVPIVCHWDRDAGEIGGHDMELEISDSGKMSLRNLTEPCGVVPESATFRFSREEDEDGVEHEYLVIDGVLLWKRQDVYSHIVSDLDGVVRHSMEITVFDGEDMDERGLYNVKRFEFTALCLLERDEPCFQGSELNVYSLNHFKTQMEQMMSELKEYYTVSAEMTDELKNSMEGGENILEHTDEINLEATEPVSESYSADEVEVSEAIDSDTTVSAESDVENVQAAETETDAFALDSEVRKELCHSVEKMEAVDLGWGECSRYWFEDFDAELHEVYCIDVTDWMLYGFSYSVDGDAVNIDLNSRKRMKYAIVPFEGTEQTSAIARVFELVNDKINESAGLADKYAEAVKSMSSMESEIADLKQFKNNIELERAEAARNEVLSSFADLDGDEAFEALKAEAANYDVDTLAEKCYAIRGKSMTPAKFNLEKSNKLVVSAPGHGAHDNYDMPYGGLIEKYTKTKN